MVFLFAARSHKFGRQGQSAYDNYNDDAGDYGACAGGDDYDNDVDYSDDDESDEESEEESEEDEDEEEDEQNKDEK